jgi:3-hydroxybutyryl-CoA dehydrogenase
MILRRKVKAGHLGRKTGKGWYEYNEDGTRKEK